MFLKSILIEISLEQKYWGFGIGCFFFARRYTVRLKSDYHQHRFCASGADGSNSTFGILLYICTKAEQKNFNSPPVQSRETNDRKLAFIRMLPASIRSNTFDTMKQKIILTFSLLTFYNLIYGQTDSLMSSKKHSIGLIIANLQVKESLNLGLVFIGPQFDLQYGFTKTIHKHILKYEAEVGGAILKSRKMEGFNIHFKPLDFSYFYMVMQTKKSQLSVGGNLLLNYNYQLYPDLQGGQSYWLSQIQISPTFMYTLKLPKNSIELQISNSLFGFVSRPPIDRNPYFFKISFNEFVSNANSHFMGGSFNSFNYTHLRISYILESSKRNYIFGYQMSYFEYYKEPKIQMVFHSLILQIQLKGK